MSWVVVLWEMGGGGCTVWSCGCTVWGVVVLWGELWLYCVGGGCTVGGGCGCTVGGGCGCTVEREKEILLGQGKLTFAVGVGWDGMMGVFV